MITSMASKSIEEIAPVIRHLRIVIGTKILSAKTTIAAGAEKYHINWLKEQIQAEEKIAEAKEENKKNQEYIKETQLELNLEGVVNV